MENHQQNPKKRDREEEDGDGFPRKKDFQAAAAAGEGNLKVKLRIGKSPPAAGEEESPEKKDHVCLECNKRFSSGKALGGHMSSAHVQANRDYSWGSKAKRGRSPIKQRSSSTSISDDEELQEAVHHLVCLGNAQNPNPEINKNNHMIGKGKEKLIDEEDGLDNHSEDSEDDEDHGITKWINPKNIDCPNPNGNASAAALSNDNNKKRRIIVENMMRPMMETHEMESTKELFKCTTCNKCFSSHQALGGHRSSHNKFRLSVQNTIDDEQTNTASAPATIPVPSPVQNPQTVANTNENIINSPNATSKYQCGVCNKVFATGKALGGHKKCHSVSQSTLLQPAAPPSSPERSSTPPDDDATGKALGGHKKCHSVSQSTLLQPAPPPSSPERSSTSPDDDATGKALGGHKKCHSVPQSTLLQPVPPNSPERSSTPPTEDDDDVDEPKRLDFDLNEIPADDE
nr:zinc finger C2H2-type/integrase DNA-binding domain-containing protein [Ipomoea batatas]